MKAESVMKIWIAISTMIGKVVILSWIGQQTMTGLEKMLPCLKNNTSHQSRLSCFSIYTKMDMSCIQIPTMWPGGWIIIQRMLCRVGEHQHRLAHQRSPFEKFIHTWSVKLHIMGIWEWGIYGLQWVGNLWLNGWGILWHIMGGPVMSFRVWLWLKWVG